LGITKMMKRTKEEALANLYLMRIHLTILKLFILKEITAWVVRIFH